MGFQPLRAGWRQDFQTAFLSNFDRARDILLLLRTERTDLFLRQSRNKPVPGHHRFDFLKVRRATGIDDSHECHLGLVVSAPL